MSRRDARLIFLWSQMFVVEETSSRLPFKRGVLNFTGNKKNNTLGQKSSLNFHVNSKIYNVIENLHQILLLTVIDSIKLNKIK